MSTPAESTVPRCLAGRERGPTQRVIPRREAAELVCGGSAVGSRRRNCNRLAGSAYPMVIIGINTPCSA